MNDPAGDIVNAIGGVISTVQADIAKIETEIAGEFTFLKHEAAVLYNWAANASPELKAILDAGLKDAEAAAVKIEQAAEGYLGQAITSGGADVETFIANFVQVVLAKGGLPDNLNPLVGNGIAYMESLLIAMVKSALPKVLAALLAPAA